MKTHNVSLPILNTFSCISEGEDSQEGEQRGGDRRPPRRPRFENRRGDFHGHDKAAAPKVNDERDFPSLG